MINNQNERRISFDQVALLYDQVRPGYPTALFEDIIAFSELPADERILEIGCGTGQATLSLARQGYTIRCLEPGDSLAAVAQQNLAPYPNADVLVRTFEDWVTDEANFDLVISATAFHWVDPVVRYPKVARVLKPNGTIALFWNKHVQTEMSVAFFEAIQTVYERIVTSMATKFPGLPHPDAISTPVKEEINGSGLFGAVTVRKYQWHQAYTSANYIRLLNTYSDHLSLPDSIRQTLFLNIAELIDVQFAGQITKEYLTILYLAHRK